MVLNQQWKKTSMRYQTLVYPKKQKLIPQTIHILVYKNAIANGLRTTKKLPLKNVKQFDKMIKYNHNLMKNNFWFLFNQLISQIIKSNEETDIVTKKWQWHF